MCLPTDEGGLGLRSLVKLNEASNLKLAWDLLSSSDSWAILMRQRVMRKHKIINHYIFSSIWSSVKSEMPSVLANSSWCLGNGKDISSWYDNWCGAPLFSSFTDLTSIKDQNVSSIIVNGNWDFSKADTIIPPYMQVQISKCHIPIEPLQDRRVWSHSQFGDLSTKLVYEFKRLNGNRKEWWRWIWAKSIPPSRSCLVWRILHRKVPTDEQWRRRNFSMASKCGLCCAAEETDQHLFFDCDYASYLWKWLQNILNLPFPISGWPDIWSICKRPFLPNAK
ncbi:uncharacterized protein LOC131628440 [Vicia villosa]|uniref:uncharacterized protein LOC131628440 n=1 Tax=Vicia villosa TaxID=3911 RepID=UPI00273C15C9|nr:uncharacterized protein LOC131628440 [Vicia villosa]